MLGDFPPGVWPDLPAPPPSDRITASGQILPGVLSTDPPTPGRMLHRARCWSRTVKPWTFVLTVDMDLFV